MIKNKLIMRKIIFFIIAAMTQYSFVFGQQNYFKREILNCIVLFEKEDSTGKLVPHGTGFLLYNYNKEGEYIVTCEHVLKNKYIYVRIPLTQKYQELLRKEPQKEVIVNNRRWIIEGNTIVTRITLIKDSTVIESDSLDLGVLKLQTGFIYSNDKDTFKVTNTSGIPKSLISTKNGIEIGTEINFLGFPFSIGTSKGYFFSGYYADENNTPLLRTGTVAWKSSKNSEFLVDAISYSGNSGSPIFTKAEVLGGNPQLIGIVIGHLSDLRFDKETDINVGLARCIWIDEVLQLISRKRF